MSAKRLILTCVPEQQQKVTFILKNLLFKPHFVPISHPVPSCWQQLPLFYQGSSSTGLEPAPNLEPVLRISTVKEQALGQGKLVPEWYQLFAGLEPRTAYIQG